MKEIPALFSTPMVQAELEGRKTKTRRIIKPQPGERPDDEGKVMYRSKWAIGDLLWVRENWQLKGWDFEEGTMTVKFATGETHKCLAHDPSEDSEWLMNQVDRLENGGYIIATSNERFEFTNKKQPFKPSIHMPKEAARIWLQVTDVRVERLHDISEDDARAEGIWLDESVSPAGYTVHGMPHWATAKECFAELWKGINGPDSWQANPFVWVVSFTVLSTTGKPDLNNQ